MPSARDPESIYGVFGRRLRGLREERRVPQEELAVLSGLTRASIANIESGRQRVLLHQLLQFAQALEVTVADLVPKVAELSKPDNADKRESMEQYLQRLREMTISSKRRVPKRE